MNNCILDLCRFAVAVAQLIKIAVLARMGFIFITVGERQRCLR